MHFILTILAFVFLLGLIVLVHEFGHFIVAKKCGVYAHEFAIGMGPTLFKKKGKKETTYSIHLLPIGGFVSMAGEDVNVKAEADKEVPADRLFCNKKYWQKLLILLAGVFMNFMLALLIYTALILSVGKYATPIPTTITELMTDYPAEEAGMQVGDQITSVIVNGKEFTVNDFSDLQIAHAAITSTQTVVYNVRRGDESLVFEVKPIYDEETHRYMLGIYGSSSDIADVKWYTAPYYGIKYAKDQFLTMLKSLRILFMPGGIKQLSGPVGVASITSDVVSQGFLPYLSLIALLSMNVGLVNLLPLPVLDGGQAVLETLQAIFRHKFSKKFKAITMTVSWSLLVLLMLYVTLNDVLKFFA